MTSSTSVSKHDPSVDAPNILLLTATITPPPGVISLARSDPSVRLDDYANALRFYLSLVGQCVDYIVFSDNSNSDVSSLKAMVDQAKVTELVEFIVFEGLDYPPVWGRGYGEFKLVEHMMTHSKIINRHPESTVWKITGRYIVKNLCRLIARKPSNFDIYCNYRNVPRRWTDTCLIAWTPNGYQAGLKNIYQELKEPNRVTNMETLFRKLLEQRSEFIKVIPRFKVTPLLKGVRGWNNSDYSRVRDLLKYYLRCSANRLMPWWWI